MRKLPSLSKHLPGLEEIIKQGTVRGDTGTTIARSVREFDGCIGTTDVDCRVHLLIRTNIGTGIARRRAQTSRQCRQLAKAGEEIIRKRLRRLEQAQSPTARSLSAPGALVKINILDDCIPAWVSYAGPSRVRHPSFCSFRSVLFSACRELTGGGVLVCRGVHSARRTCYVESPS